MFNRFLKNFTTEKRYGNIKLNLEKYGIISVYMKTIMYEIITYMWRCFYED